MKRIKCAICVVFLMAIFYTRSHPMAVEAAQENGSLYAVNVVAELGSTFEVPICIKNNPGIMGLGVDVYYDKSVISPVSVEKGEVFESGMLTDSIGTADNEGKLKVLWSSTENVVKDGELFVIKFTSNGTMENFLELKITCSKADTFNENWQEVLLETQNGEIRIKAEAVEGDVSTDEGNGEISSSKTEKIVESANIEKAEEIYEKVKSKIPKKEIREKIKTVLDEFKVSQIEQIPESEQSNFIQRVSALFQESGEDIQPLWEDTSKTGKMKILSLLWNEVSDVESIAEAKERSEKKAVVGNRSIVIFILFLFVVFGLLFIYQKKRREKKHETKE